MPSLAQGSRLEKGEGKKKRGDCDLRSFRQTSAQIFRCSRASEHVCVCVCDAARPESSDIIAFLVKEPDGSEVPNWRAPFKPAS